MREHGTSYLSRLELLFLTGDDRARPTNLRHLEAGERVTEGDRDDAREDVAVALRRCQSHSQRLVGIMSFSVSARFHMLLDFNY